jgi:hypothetical protein
MKMPGPSAAKARQGAPNMIRVEGYAYDQQTKDWTKRVVYIARNRMEAIRWINFQRDWMNHLRILDEEET